MTTRDDIRIQVLEEFACAAGWGRSGSVSFEQVKWTPTVGTETMRAEPTPYLQRIVLPGVISDIRISFSWRRDE